MSRTRVTIKDVAQDAGVSVSTVSYVINNSGPVAPERRERVLESCRKLGYTPNSSARRLRGQFTSTIGLVVPDLVNPFFAMVAEGVEKQASERDVLVVFCAPEAGDNSESVNARLLRSQRLDGVVYLAGAATPLDSLVKLTSLGPVVLVDEQLPGVTFPCVVADNRGGARLVAQHVIDQGHEQIGIIGGPSSLWTAVERLAGYQEAIKEAGIDESKITIVEGDYRMESGKQLAARMLLGSALDRPTALLCANDLMAIGALEYARSVGMTVPTDMSVVGFDDLPIAELLQPRLTTVRQPARDMGYRAAQILLDLIEGSEPEPLEPLPVMLQIRESVTSFATTR